jgi:hypothetical protein
VTTSRNGLAIEIRVLYGFPSAKNILSRLGRFGENTEKEIDARLPESKLVNSQNEPDAKAILPEPHMVKGVISHQSPYRRRKPDRK